MSPAQIVLLVNLATDLAERAVRALNYIKQGDVSDAQLDELVSDDNTARDDLVLAIARARGREAAAVAPAPVADPPAPVVEDGPRLSDFDEDDGQPRFPQR